MTRVQDIIIETLESRSFTARIDEIDDAYISSVSDCNDVARIPKHYGKYESPATAFKGIVECVMKHLVGYSKTDTIKSVNNVTGDELYPVHEQMKAFPEYECQSH